MCEKVLAKASTLRRKRGATDASEHASRRGRYRSTRRSAAHAWVCGMCAGAARFAFGAPPNALKFGQHRLAILQGGGQCFGAFCANAEVDGEIQSFQHRVELDALGDENSGRDAQAFAGEVQRLDRIGALELRNVELEAVEI